MGYLFKKYWYVLVIALCINIPLIILGITKTNKTIVLKGDTTIVENFVEIENPHHQEGSLSTIYVISVDHCTILQQWMTQASSTSEVSDMSSSYLHFTTSELNQAAKIQHDSSLNHSLVHAYQAANCTLKCEIGYLLIDYYAAGSELRIGDKVVAVNQIKGGDAFYEAFQERQFVNQYGQKYDDYYRLKAGDVLTIERGGNTIEVTLSKDELMGGYIFYNIDEESANPSYRIKPSNVGGPSGGLLQTLALYNSLIEEDITKGKKIAGTGTINVDGTVGMIGGIQQKIYTAFDDGIEVFLCPAGNYEEALIAYNQLPNKNMKLYSVSSFKQALEVLQND